MLIQRLTKILKFDRLHLATRFGYSSLSFEFGAYVGLCKLPVIHISDLIFASDFLSYAIIAFVYMKLMLHALIYFKNGKLKYGLQDTHSKSSPISIYPSLARGTMMINYIAVLLLNENIFLYHIFVFLLVKFCCLLYIPKSTSYIIGEQKLQIVFRKVTRGSNL